MGVVGREGEGDITARGGKRQRENKERELELVRERESEKRDTGEDTEI